MIYKSNKFIINVAVAQKLVHFAKYFVKPQISLANNEHKPNTNVHSNNYSIDVEKEL